MPRSNEIPYARQRPLPRSDGRIRRERHYARLEAHRLLVQLPFYRHDGDLPIGDLHDRGRSGTTPKPMKSKKRRNARARSKGRRKYDAKKNNRRPYRHHRALDRALPKRRDDGPEDGAGAAVAVEVSGRNTGDIDAPLFPGRSRRSKPTARLHRPSRLARVQLLLDELSLLHQLHSKGKHHHRPRRPRIKEAKSSNPVISITPPASCASEYIFQSHYDLPSTVPQAETILCYRMNVHNRAGPDNERREIVGRWNNRPQPPATQSPHPQPAAARDPVDRSRPRSANRHGEDVGASTASVASRDNDVPRELGGQQEKRNLNSVGSGV